MLLYTKKYNVPFTRNIRKSIRKSIIGVPFFHFWARNRKRDISSPRILEKAGDDISESKLHPIFAIYSPNYVSKATDKMAGALQRNTFIRAKMGEEKRKFRVSGFVSIRQKLSNLKGFFGF